MTQLNPDLPQFALGMRGYDRDQVDEYVARLNDWAQDWKDRATAAEASARAAAQQVTEMRERLARLEPASFSSTPPSIQALGDRVGAILQSAFDAAAEVRAEADAKLDTARGEAEAIVGEASQESARLLETARTEAERITSGAHSELRSLVERRDSVVTHLSELHRQLAGTLGVGEVVVDLRESGESDQGQSLAEEAEVAPLEVEGPTGQDGSGSIFCRDDMTVLMPTISG